MNIAIIPARAGSKRILNKNIKSFAGQPLIAYSIKAALSSKLFDEVIVSTDSEEIAKLSRSYGATTPFMRPEHLADDYTTTRAVIEHAINTLIEQDKEIDYCCCIYASAPFIQIQYLQQGLEALKRQIDKSFAFSVSSFDFPVQRALSLQNGNMSPMFPEFVETRSQDLDEAVHDAGQFYWGHAQAFLGKHALFSEHSIGIQIPRHLVQDIDTIEDWTRAELMYQAYIKDFSEKQT